MTKSGWTFPDDLNEAAWVLLANAWNGNWDDAPEDWKQAAIRWRDAYHSALPRTGDEEQ